MLSVERANSSSSTRSSIDRMMVVDFVSLQQQQLD
jgi:hypothetical protein